MAVERVLVPISETVTVRQTVGYAVQSGLERGDALECHLAVVLPYDEEMPEGRAQAETADRLLSRARNWVEEDAGEADVSIETAVLGTDQYLFGPRDYTEVLEAYATEHEIDRVVLDPEFQPGATAELLQPLERELEAVGLHHEEAPVERPARHERLVGVDTHRFDRLLATFVLSFGFYLVLGDPTYWFDLLTGLAVAGVVSVSLGHVAFSYPLDRVRSPIRVLRFFVYVPYLLWEIVKANIAVSIVILRPSMPIEPTLTRFNARVRSGLPLTALANSITLTPGTLTVRADDQRLLVHTLIPSAREDLFDGGLERGIRFVFYGRKAAGLVSPRERGDAEIVGGEEL